MTMITPELRAKLHTEWIRQKITNCDLKGLKRDYIAKHAKAFGFPDSVLMDLSFGSMIKKEGDFTVGIVYSTHLTDVERAKYESYEEDRGNTFNAVLSIIDKVLASNVQNVWVRFGQENLELGKENLGSRILIRGAFPSDVADLG